jgi:hypothetical protein
MFLTQDSEPRFFFFACASRLELDSVVSEELGNHLKT